MCRDKKTSYQAVTELAGSLVRSCRRCKEVSYRERRYESRIERAALDAMDTADARTFNIGMLLVGTSLLNATFYRVIGYRRGGQLVMEELFRELSGRDIAEPIVVIDPRVVATIDRHEDGTINAFCYTKEPYPTRISIRKYTGRV